MRIIEQLLWWEIEDCLEFFKNNENSDQYINRVYETYLYELFSNYIDNGIHNTFRFSRERLVHKDNITDLEATKDFIGYLLLFGKSVEPIGKMVKGLANSYGFIVGYRPVGKFIEYKISPNKSTLEGEYMTVNNNMIKRQCTWLVLGASYGVIKTQRHYFFKSRLTERIMPSTETLFNRIIDKEYKLKNF